MAGLLRRRDLELPDLRREIDRMFEDFLAPIGGTMGEVTQFAPRLEITEDEGKYLLRAELPGMKPEEVEVNVQNGVLTMRGERKREVEKKFKGYEYSEFGYGRFSRSIQLPPGVDASKVEARFNNGVLEVTVPKSEAAKPKKISIETGAGTTPPRAEATPTQPTSARH